MGVPAAALCFYVWRCVSVQCDTQRLEINEEPKYCFTWGGGLETMEEEVDLVGFVSVQGCCCFLCFICLPPPDLHFVKFFDFPPRVSSEMPFLNAALGSCLELTLCCWRRPKSRASCRPEASSVTPIEASLCFYLSHAAEGATTAPPIVLDHVNKSSLCSDSSILSRPRTFGCLGKLSDCWKRKDEMMRQREERQEQQRRRRWRRSRTPFFFGNICKFSSVTFTLSHFYLPLPLPVSLRGRLSHISSAFTPLLLLSPFPQSFADS